MTRQNDLNKPTRRFNFATANLMHSTYSGRKLVSDMWWQKEESPSIINSFMGLPTPRQNLI